MATALDVITERGLYALGIVGALSAVSTLSLLIYMAVRMIHWRNFFKTSLAHNQYIVLIQALLIFDLLYGISFSISWYWLAKKGIDTPGDHAACFTQGFLMTLGDVGSAIFIIIIAAHTSYQVGMGRRLSDGVFLVVVLFGAALAIFLACLAPVLHGTHVFATAADWCWIDQRYESLRLGTLYFWVFLAEGVSAVIYGGLWWKLYRARRVVNTITYADAKSNRFKRAATLMAIYPIVYAALTLPLASVRMAMYAHRQIPQWAYIMAGCLMTSCGWADCILYVITRRALLKEDLKSPFPSHVKDSTVNRSSMPPNDQNWSQFYGRSRYAQGLVGKSLHDTSAENLEAPMMTSLTDTKEEASVVESKEDRNSDDSIAAVVPKTPPEEQPEPTKHYSYNFNFDLGNFQNKSTSEVDRQLRENELMRSESMFIDTRSARKSSQTVKMPRTASNDRLHPGGIASNSRHSQHSTSRPTTPRSRGARPSLDQFVNKIKRSSSVARGESNRAYGARSLTPNGSANHATIASFAQQHNGNDVGITVERQVNVEFLTKSEVSSINVDHGDWAKLR